MHDGYLFYKEDADSLRVDLTKMTTPRKAVAVDTLKPYREIHIGELAGDDIAYLNDGSGRFTAGPRIPMPGINDPRGIAFADIDSDGDLDFAVACKRAGNQMIRNDVAGGNWLKVKLISPHGQAGAFGAKTLVYASDDRGHRLLGMREPRSNNGYLGQNDPVLHFGLGQNESVDVVVTFLNGATIRRAAVGANQLVTVDGRQSSK